MSRGINKVILIGNLGKDPELRYGSSNGSAVCNVALATNEAWKDKNGEKHERTEWHSIVFFGHLAEISAEHMRKGSQIYVEGRLRSRKWQDNSGIERYRTEIVGNEMQLLGSRPEGFARQDYNYNSNSEAEKRERRSPRGYGQGQQRDHADDEPIQSQQKRTDKDSGEKAYGQEDKFDDDIPF